MLTSVNSSRYTLPEPLYCMVIGKDKSGDVKVVWIRGNKPGNLSMKYEYLKNGMSKDRILSKMAKLGYGLNPQRMKPDEPVQYLNFLTSITL